MKSNISHKDLEQAAKLSGISEQELIDRAVLLYLESFRGITDLKTEMKQWDILSDEALERMEFYVETP